MKLLVKITCIAAIAAASVSCSDFLSGPNTSPLAPDSPSQEQGSASDLSLDRVARIFAALPLSDEQVQEVHDAASGSSSNGYDEEYTLRQLLNNPGAGVGDSPTKAGNTYSKPIRDLLKEYLSSTKAGASDVENYLSKLSESDLQIYWPYSEDWDGETYPIITFDPGNQAESNYGYVIEKGKNGFYVADSVFVDETVAMERPVWVINNNDDSEFTPLEFYTKAAAPGMPRTSGSRQLKIRDFTMLRNYDSWFGGASEFFIKCGAVNGFNASTEAELKLYQPSVTDFMVVVKRKYKGVVMPLDAIILTDFTNQMENMAFLITEDDGGTRTTWKCSATVKIRSRSYGFDVEIPFNEKDDIVWRGQLSATYFQEEDFVHGRFGDVEITFELD